MQNTLCLILTLATAIVTQATAQDAIFPKGNKAPNVHHTGAVWLNHVSDADSTFDYNIVLATFEAGAKLDWHIHPGGQQLLITMGTGYYQERGKPAAIVRTGDVVKCLPGVEHWHAAAPDSDFAYLAVTGKQPTKWLEPVTDEAYNSVPASMASHAEKEIIALSRKKWKWMAEKKVAELSALFHEQAKFVHMGGTWGKDQEIDVIHTGGIHYKEADIHEVSVTIIGNTAILLNRITLVAVVGGNEVANPFMVTEVYNKEDDSWQLANLSFTKLLAPES